MSNKVLQPIISLFKSLSSEEEKKLKKAVAGIIGERPNNISLFQLAFRHTSASKETSVEGFRESNERLEYLGDAVLGMIVAEFLFTKYPFRDEGFLTEIRSRIVNRESLNQIARKLGIDKFIEYDGSFRSMSPRSSVYGDALEAFVGAVYMDKGFAFARRFVIGNLLTHYDLDSIVQNNFNFKSQIIEWGQRENREVRFEITEERGNWHHREFISQLYVDDEPFAKGNGYSKKKAEQSAAEQACIKLELI